MASALLYDRLQFAFTATFHYLFPQLTMGLALLIVYLKSRALRTGDEHDRRVARFWVKIFAISFAFGVVTGIPLEFQFSTNWARFSTYAGGVIGQTLGMEGLFAFFLESSFLGILLFGEERLGPRAHWFAALMLFLGSWLSGWFIIATNAWMQHPVAYQVAADGTLHVTSLLGLFANDWLLWQYLHNMTAAVATGSFVMAAVGAYYQLSGQHLAYARTFLRTGVVAAAAASFFLLFPTGHEAGKQVFASQPATGAAFEGVFHNERGAGIVLVGQPNMETLTIDNAITVPWALSILVYQRAKAEVRGLDTFPRDTWPDNVPLLYYAYHIMIGLGTVFVAVTGAALFWLWRGRLFDSRWLLWLLMLSAPLPYIATTAGWMTAELGRQPWLVYGLLRTADGASPLISSGNALFTLIGFMGLYTLLGLLFLFLIFDTIKKGPACAPPSQPAGGSPGESR
ncbi:MAG: cytochrome ubiquinol oxidase subunit I [Nitrospiraceae bacterium]